jgi:hypothetical protein
VIVFVTVGVGAGAVLVVAAELALSAAPLQLDKTVMRRSATTLVASFNGSPNNEQVVSAPYLGKAKRPLSRPRK